MRQLVGREREAARLRDGVRHAATGRGQLFVLVGEPGIGKSRLAEEAAREAAASGCQVAWGRAWEAGGAPAYWPWIEVLRRLARLEHGPPIIRELGDVAAELGQLMPELGLPPPPSGLGPEQARFRLFDAVATFVMRAAATTPLMLLFDDLHAADRGSLMLLEFVTRGIGDARLCVVATYRELEARLNAAASDVLNRLARSATMLTLERLGPASCEALLGQIDGLKVTPAVLATVVRITEGNPLFVGEIGRVLARSPGRAHIDGVALPPGIREAIQSRLAALSPDTRALLAEASTFGRTIDITALAALASRPVADVEHALAEAAALDIVQAIADPLAAPRAYAFAHILTREALYRELAPAVRAELHRRAGEGLERRWIAAPDPHLAEIAHHFLMANVAPKAFDYALRAADEAMRQLAFDDAARLRESALALIDARDAASAGTRADVLRALAEALLQAGEIERGKATALLSADAARVLGDGDRLARAAIVHGMDYTHSIRDEAQIGLLREALAAIAPGAIARRATLLARLSSALIPAPDPAEPWRLGREAMALARGLGDPEVLLDVLHACGTGIVFSLDPHERLAFREEVLALALALGRRAIVPRSRGFLALTLLCLGESARASFEADELARVTAALRLPQHEWWAPLLRSGIAIASGRFALAAQCSAEARALAERTSSESARIPLLFNAFGLAAAQGDRAALARLREPILALATGPRLFGRVPAAYLHCQLGELAEARALLDSLPRGLIGGLLPPTAHVADVIADLGPSDRAHDSYETLLRYANEDVVWGNMGMVCEGPVTRVLGRLAVLLGRWDDAAAHFEDALARAERSGYRAVMVRILSDHATLYGRRDAAGDRERARPLLERALALARELGMEDVALKIGTRILPLSAVAVVPLPAASEPGVIVLVREGDVWRITCGAIELRLQTSLGLEYLDHLIRHAGEEVPALVLMGLGKDVASAQAAGDAGPVLDERAKAVYRKRLAELRAALDEAIGWNDGARAERARGEIEALEGELGRAVGLGGRDRRAASANERARVNVQRRLRDVFAKIGEHHPELGKHLRLAVRTGARCVYVPMEQLFRATARP